MEDNQTQPAAAPDFFPTLTKPIDSNAPSDSKTESNDSKWFIMEGLEGQGERPAYFSPKYKTLVDQAKAYQELEKKLGSSKAPDKYDLSKYESILNPEDMNTQKLINVAREKHLSQEALDGVLDVFSEFVNTNKIDPSKEIEKLGPQGRDKINVVAQWIQNTFSDKTIEAINRLPKNADFVILMDEIRQLQYHNTVNVPVSPEAKFVPMTVGEVEAEMKANFKKYETDPRYRAEIKAKFAQAIGED